MIGDWNVSRYIPDMAGPIDIPIRNKRTVIPIDTPLTLGDTETNVILKPPTSANDKPPAIIDKFIIISSSVEWYINRLEKPITLMTLPMIVGFILPNLDIKKPDKTEIIKEIIMKGSCTFAASIALPPNPDGRGFLISIDMVW